MVEIPDIIPSGAHSQIVRDHFGNKIASLEECRSLGFKVPDGFYISARLANNISKARSIGGYIRLLDKWVSTLISRNASDELIVRSSSVYEDEPGMLFSGLFDSYTDIFTSEDLVHAIQKIVTGARAPALLPYFERVERDINSTHMAVCVQKKVHPKYSGFFACDGNDVRFEFTCGHLAGIAHGNQAVLNAKLIMHHRMFEQENKFDEFLGFEKCILNCIDFDALQKLRSIHPKAVCEFAVNEDGFFVLQLKKNGGNIYSPLECGVNSAEASDIQHGASFSKSESMKWFKEHSLFNLPLLIIEAGHTPREASLNLQKFLKPGQKSTLRFSSGNDLGLPRFFSDQPSEILSFLRKNFRREYDVIVHDYIDVVRSFEILIRSDGSVLMEHIPGMWESDNGLQPDVFELRGRLVTCLVCSDWRKVRKEYASDRNEIDWGKPLHNSECLMFAQCMDKIRSEFENSSECKLPINIHAVFDGTSKEFQCLNSRPGFLDDTMKKSPLGTLTTITSKQDLHSWDGIGSLRLALQVARGSEDSLVQLAESLKDAGVSEVYVDFGLLSHPAMVLREYGCTLTPSYLLPSALREGNYREVELSLDSNDEPYTRISIKQ